MQICPSSSMLSTSTNRNNDLLKDQYVVHCQTERFVCYFIQLQSFSNNYLRTFSLLIMCIFPSICSNSNWRITENLLAFPVIWKQ